MNLRAAIFCITFIVKLKFLRGIRIAWEEHTTRFAINIFQNVEHHLFAHILDDIGALNRQLRRQRLRVRDAVRPYPKPTGEEQN